jgi:hypothetical protein
MKMSRACYKETKLRNLNGIMLVKPQGKRRKVDQE